MVFSSQLGGCSFGSLELGAIGGPAGPPSLDQYPTSIISFTQFVTQHGAISRSGSSSLHFIQSVNVAKVLSKSVSHSITFVPINSEFTVHTLSNSITFTQAATAQKYKGVVHSLVFSQSLVNQYNPHNDFKQHVLSFIQSPTVSLVLPRPINNTLSIIQSVSGVRVRFFSASDIISFNESVVTIKIVFPHNNLVLTDSVSVQKISNRTVITPLSFDDSVNTSVVYTRSVHNNINFVGGQNRQINLSQNSYYYIPTVIVTKPTDVVVLQSSGQVIVLPAPEMGDGFVQQDSMNLRRAMNGTIYTYVKRTGLAKLEYKFIMDRPKAYELRVFIQNNLSLQQVLTNWKGEIWVGYMANNPFNFTNIPGYGTCGELYEATIEFEGTRVH